MSRGKSDICLLTYNELDRLGDPVLKRTIIEKVAAKIDDEVMVAVFIKTPDNENDQVELYGQGVYFADHMQWLRLVFDGIATGYEEPINWLGSDYMDYIQTTAPHNSYDSAES